MLELICYAVRLRVNDRLLRIKARHQEAGSARRLQVEGRFASDHAPCERRDSDDAIVVAV